MPDPRHQEALLPTQRLALYPFRIHFLSDSGHSAFSLFSFFFRDQPSFPPVGLRALPPLSNTWHTIDERHR